MRAGASTTSGQITRRDVLRAAAFGAAALGAGGLAVAGCASTTPSPAPSGTAAGASPATGSAIPSAAASETILPLRQRIARMLVVGFRGMAVDDAPWLEAAIRDDGLGGVILFDRDGRSQGPRNIKSPEQVTALCAGLKALAPDREVIIAIDQEGGQVTRLSTKYGFPALVSEQKIGPQDEAAVRTWADGLAATLAEVGVNLNFAPVVDVNVNPDNPAIGKLRRSFSADPAIVARDAGIEILAHRTAGVKTAIKHFPGLGSATGNTDYGVEDVTDTWTNIELEPYRDLIGRGLVDVVMAAHVVNGQIDPNAPASLSNQTVTGVLRGVLGWDGVVVTDDLQAGAITDAFGFDDAVELAIEAGNDLLLFANQQAYSPKVIGRVVDLVEGLVTAGRISEARIDASVARVAALFNGRSPASG